MKILCDILKYFKLFFLFGMSTKNGQLDKLNPTQRREIEKVAKRLVEDYDYRYRFLENPKSFVEAEAKMKLDKDLMKTVWVSVRKLTDQNGQPKEGKLEGITLD